VLHYHLRPTPTPALYTLSLHDALPILRPGVMRRGEAVSASTTGKLRHECRGFLLVDLGDHAGADGATTFADGKTQAFLHGDRVRSEEHTSELQSRFDLVCRLLLEKKKE